MIDNSEAKVKGEHILTVCDMRSDRAQRLERLICDNILKRDNLIKAGLANRERLKELWAEYKHFLKQLNDNYATQQTYVLNVTTTVGRSVLAQRLGGDTTYTGVVNYGALGTDATAPTVGDTTLGTETYRKALSSGTDNNNIAYLENFYTATEVSGTFEEYGFFIDGTGTVDTGQMFNRFTQTVTKSVTESLNVQSIVILSDA